MRQAASDNRLLEYELMKAYPHLSCFSTTRHGGCSEGNYASFNCNDAYGDSPEAVAQNRRILCGLLPQAPLEWVIPRQVHGTRVCVVDSASPSADGVDALVTNLPGYCLCVSTADCIPVLLYDTRRQAVAAIHAGWRGTVGRIVEKTIAVMEKQYGTEGKEVVACIGPGISLKSFEVGDEVYDAFRLAGFDMERIARREEKWHIDLWEANRLQLLACGVREDKIEVAGICTYRRHCDFFSARRLGIRSGRILSGILMHRAGPVIGKSL